MEGVEDYLNDSHNCLDSIGIKRGSFYKSFDKFVCIKFIAIGILGQVWCLIVYIPDLCPLSYFLYLTSIYI